MLTWYTPATCIHGPLIVTLPVDDQLYKTGKKLEEAKTSAPRNLWNECVRRRLHQLACLQNLIQSMTIFSLKAVFVRKRVSRSNAIKLIKVSSLFLSTLNTQQIQTILSWIGFMVNSFTNVISLSEVSLLALLHLTLFIRSNMDRPTRHKEARRRHKEPGIMIITLISFCSDSINDIVTIWPWFLVIPVHQCRS